MYKTSPVTEFHRKEAYRETVRLLIALHKLMKVGQSEGVEADAVRDQMDDYWEGLSEEETDRVRGMSADLYTLEPDSPIVHPLVAPNNGDDPFCQSLQSARTEKNYSLALKLLREHPGKIDACQAALLRGISYEKLGEPDVAALFFEGALSLKPSDDSIACLVMIAFDRLGRHEAALAWVEQLRPQILSRHPALLVVVAKVLRGEAMRSNPPNMKLLHESADLLRSAIQRTDLNGSIEPVKAPLVNALVEQGVCYRRVGRLDDAITSLDQALRISPHSDLALTIRGIVKYPKEHEEALKDFEMAIEEGTMLAWPYFYLAFEALKASDANKCIDLAYKAIERTSDAELLANLFEWLAISHAEMNASPEIVERLFAQALIHWPGHPQIRYNQYVFESRVQQSPMNFRLSDEPLAHMDVGRLDSRLDMRQAVCVM